MEGSLVQDSPAALCCVIEQEILYPLLSTSSTKEEQENPGMTLKLLTGCKASTQTKIA